MLPHLILAYEQDKRTVSKGDRNNKIKTVVNRKHINGVQIIHDIDDKLMATYSKHDKKIKIWDKTRLILLSEYNVNEGEINEIFSIGKKLFAKARDAFYKIDLTNGVIEQVMSDAYLSSSTIINSRFIVFVDKSTRYHARLVAYDYFSDEIKFSEPDIGLCGGCRPSNAYYLNNKYYVFIYDDYAYVYGKDLSFEKTLDRNDGISKEKVHIEPNVVKISKDIENEKNIPEWKLATNRKKLIPAIKGKINKRYGDIHIISERSKDVPSFKGFSLRKFYLNNKQTGESKLIVAGPEEYAAINTTHFSEEFVDIKNEIIAIRGHSYGNNSFFVVDFSGNIVGETEGFHWDDIDLVPIANYLFLINYTKGLIISYNLKSQDKVTSAKSEVIGGKKINLLIGAAYAKDYPRLQTSNIFNDVGDVVDINLKGNLFISKSADITTKAWDLNTGKLLATLYLLDDNTDVVITPEGYFSGKGKYQDYVHFVDEKFNVYQFDQFERKFHRPRMMQIKYFLK